MRPRNPPASPTVSSSGEITKARGGVVAGVFAAVESPENGVFRGEGVGGAAEEGTEEWVR